MALHWTDIKSLECLSVCVYVCVCVCVSAKRFVHDSDHNFCQIFLKFGTWVRNVIVKTPFGGQVSRVNSPPFIPPKTAFWGEPPAKANGQHYSVYLNDH